MAPDFLSGLQSLSLNPAASSAAGQGSTFMGPGQGAWTVNVGGSGTALQGDASTVLILVGVALVAVWLLKK